MLQHNSNFEIIKAKYPHIAEQISVCWSDICFTQTICKLLMDSRDGTRAGFPIEIAKAMFALIKEHDAIYPQLAILLPDTLSNWTYGSEVLR